jgi:hypothetical protein
VTSCIVDSAAIYIMVVKIRNTICPPQPQLSLHRRAALSSESNGTRSYIAERTQSAVYIVRCLWSIYSQVAEVKKNLIFRIVGRFDSALSWAFSWICQVYFFYSCAGKASETYRRGDIQRRINNRYLMCRLSLQVFYLWRHVLATAPPFILWWSNLEILFGPLHRGSPFIGELRCQAIQTKHGPYIEERTQKAVYIVRCLWVRIGRRYMSMVMLRKLNKF